MTNFDDRTPERPQRIEGRQVPVISGDEKTESAKRKPMSGCGFSALLGIGSVALLWLAALGAGGPGGFVMLMQAAPAVIVFIVGCAIYGLISLARDGRKAARNASDGD